MKDFNNNPKMGVILCKHCEKEIEAVDTPKVMTYYSYCGEGECNQATQREYDRKGMKTV